MLGEDVEKGNLPTLLVGMSIGAAPVENSMEVLRKLKIEILYDSVILLLGIYPKKTKSLI